MFLVILVVFAVVLYLPPVHLVRHFFVPGPATPLIRDSLLISVHNALVTAGLVCGYVVASLLALALVRYLWPGEKPRVFQRICQPDELGALNLFVLAVGGWLLVSSLTSLAPLENTVLGAVMVLGVVGHFWEMTEWEYDAMEAVRRRWAREL